MTEACADCLRRTWLIARLAPNIDRTDRKKLRRILALNEDDLIGALAGRARGEIAREYDEFKPSVSRAEATEADMGLVCRHDPDYPAKLVDVADAPALLHVRGDRNRFVEVVHQRCVAIVGARRATPYGLQFARAIGRDMGRAGVPVISGMAMGIDAAAHAGCLEAGGTGVAVLGGGADVPYPASKRTLYRRLTATGSVVSEMPPGFRAFRWSFPARNRIIAGLADLILVVEGAEHSGSLITADFATQLGREVSAVPGPVTSRASRGTNALLKDGAHLVRGAQDVLDLMFGAGAVDADAVGDVAAGLSNELRAIYEAVGDGKGTATEIARHPVEITGIAAGLTELEVLGLISRGPGSRYLVAA